MKNQYCVLKDFSLQEIQWKEQHLDTAYRSPSYHHLYLSSHSLVELNRDKESLLTAFRVELGVDLLRKELQQVLNKDPDSWLQEVIGYTLSPLGFVTIAHSPKGNPYLKKLSLSPVIAQQIHAEVICYKEPRLFLYVILSYLDSMGFYTETMPVSWKDLVGEARKEFLSHELSTFIQYQEQAIYLSSYLFYQLVDISSEEIQGNIALTWIQQLAKNLYQWAYVLPLGKESHFYPSPYLRGKGEIHKSYSNLFFWVFFCSPLTYQFRFIIFDIISILWGIPTFRLGVAFMAFQSIRLGIVHWQTIQTMLKRKS